MVVKLQSALEICDFIKRDSLFSLDSTFELAGLRCFFKLLTRERKKRKNLKFQNPFKVHR